MTEKSAGDDTSADFLALIGNVSPIKPNNQAVQNIKKPSVIPKFSIQKEPKVDSRSSQNQLSVFAEYQASTPLKTNNYAILEKQLTGKTKKQDANQEELFRSEFSKTVGAITPIETKNKKWIEPPKPKPYARTQATIDNEELGALPSDHVPWSANERDNDELVFLKPALEKNVLKRLRQGEWPIQASLDFHGNSLDTARERFISFMQQVEKAQLRCVRLVHGKGLGSKNGVPIIKQTLRAWLIQQQSVLAFCPSKNEPGGAGSTLVLLRLKKEPQP